MDFRKTRTTLLRNAASMLGKRIPKMSSFHEDFRIMYERIMVARGELVLMLNEASILKDKNLTKKFMELLDLNHKIDDLICLSENILISCRNSKD